LKVQTLLDRWRDDLAGWAIPEHIAAAVAESPWVLPRQMFARRADRVLGAPAGPSYERAWAALDPPGRVLDVGSGAGAACLPLLPRTTTLTAVDSDTGMLALLAERAAVADAYAQCVPGRWPQVAGDVPAADVVTCSHVLYNVPDVAPFVTELTAHARRLVVVELTARHPLAALNGLWLRFHGLTRPQSPTAADLLDILTAMELRPACQRWQRPVGADFGSAADLADVTRRRLCLPPERTAEVAAALAETPAAPPQIVTIWWAGTARP
jgi:SAM-dependent methyltransferase